MNTSQYLAEVADVLDDPASKMYSAAAIVRHGDRQLRGLYRTLVESNKQYSNFTIGIQKEVALEPIDNVFDYRLPSWVMAVTRVWIRQGAGATETSVSLYLWTSGAAQLGQEIRRRGAAQERTPAWSWQGSNTLRLHNFGEAQELAIEVAVRPPKMLKGLIGTANASASKFYLPSTPSYGDIEIEAGAYINSDWQVTGTATANALHYGQIRRCVYSDANALDGLARVHELTMDAAFTNVLAQGDTIETVLPLPDEHTRVLVLLAARACLQQKGNIKGLESIQGELLQEMARFAQFATPPRDTAGPTTYKRQDGAVAQNGWGWGWNRYFGGI